jgi:hypothetical protein
MRGTNNYGKCKACEKEGVERKLHPTRSRTVMVSMRRRNFCGHQLEPENTLSNQCQSAKSFPLPTSLPARSVLDSHSIEQSMPAKAISTLVSVKMIQLPLKDNRWYVESDTYLFLDRWAFIQKPSMLFSYLLNPSMHGDPTMRQNDRLGAIRTLKNYTTTFFSEVDDQRACVNQIHEFNSSFAVMGLEEKRDYQDMTPASYWATFGLTQYPLLQQIALRVFQVPTSSAASERVWKVFSFIHSKRRNRLKSSKVEKLAFIYINAALLDQEDDRDYLLGDMDDSMFVDDSSDEDEVVIVDPMHDN